MPITQDPNPYFAGYNAHKAAKAEVAALEQDAAYKGALMEEYQRKAAAEAANAPFEAQKLQTEQLLKEQKLKQRQMETLQKEAAWTAQHILPPLQAFKKGMMNEEQLASNVREIVARSDLGIDPQQLEQILAQGPQAIEQVVQASMSVLDQMKPPPAPPKPYSMQVGDQVQYFDPMTQQPIPGLGGARWSPRPAGGITIKPPSGYRFNGNDLEPIPGGPGDPETTAKLAKARASASGERKTAESGGAKTGAILGAINGISGMLNQAAAEGDIVTGVVGTAKRFGGGLARQAGVPVSPRAEGLSRALERLQAIAGPALLADTRLSDDERRRVKDIVGNIDPFTDDVALRQSLAELAAIVHSLDGQAQSPAVASDGPPVGAPVAVNEDGRKVYFNGTEWVGF